jgi:hypothetical protein
MDDVLTKVRHYINVKKMTNENGISLEEALEMIPPGYHQIYKLFFVEMLRLGAVVISIEIKKSVLFTKTNKMDFLPVKWLVDGLAKESTRWCMLTPGIRGSRRKLVKGWPCLSTPLWLEYANEIPESEWEINGSK